MSKPLSTLLALQPWAKCSPNTVKEYNVDVIAVVRRADQVESLKTIGAQYIVNTSDADWKGQLKTLAKDLGATLGFDAVGGSLTGEVLECMPNGLTARDFIVQSKTVRGFWLGPYKKQRGTWGFLATHRKLVNGLKSSFAPTIHQTYALDDAAKAVCDYGSNMSDNNFAFKPSQSL
ncbi:hypothetical protein AeRB84_006029 [Aphanomyces euteiches]|nr:hypothetical protein AeRB84_006029 [Aphanomyces euteiches]